MVLVAVVADEAMQKKVVHVDMAATAAQVS